MGESGLIRRGENSFEFPPEKIGSMVRHTLSYPTQRYERIVDKYPDSKRRLYVYKPDQVPYVMRRLLNVTPVEIHFWDRSQRAKITINLPSINSSYKKDTIKIFAAESKKGDFFQKSFEEQSLVSFDYKDGRLFSAKIQAEGPSDEREELSKDLDKAFTLFINRIRDNDSSSLLGIKEGSEMLFLSVIKERFGTSDHPLAWEARDLARLITDKLLESKPFEDREELERLLVSVGWLDNFSLSLLRAQKYEKTETIAEAVKREGVDKILLEEVNQESLGMKSDPDFARRQIQMHDFSGEGFRWNEIEAVSSSSISIRDEITTIRDDEDAKWGSEINSQGNSFKITREDDSIKIECVKRGKRGIWKFVGSLLIPHEDIVAGANSLDFDFRMLRSRLGMKLDATEV